MEKISVIVPIYNSGQYLEECLQSIRNQTYTNLEVILVYTSCEDQSLNICNKYVNMDTRFHLVINEKNILGVYYARNLGLQNVTGDYLTFVDSDDYIATDMYELLVTKLLQYDADISICKETRKKAALLDSAGEDVIMSKDEGKKQFINGKLFYGEVWNKLFKWNQISELRFNKAKIADDIEYVWKIINQVNSIVYTDTPRYFYRCNPTGLTHSYKRETYEDSMIVFNRMKKIMESNLNKNIELNNLFNYRMMIYQAQSYLSAKECRLNDKDLEKEIRINYMKLNRKPKNKEGFSKKEKMITELYMINPRVMYAAYKIYKMINKREL